MTPEESAFLQAIAAAPADGALRLVYGDWLEENERGEEASWVRATAVGKRPVVQVLPPGIVHILMNVPGHPFGYEDIPLTWSPWFRVRFLVRWPCRPWLRDLSARVLQEGDRIDVRGVNGEVEVYFWNLVVMWIYDDSGRPGYGTGGPYARIIEASTVAPEVV